MGEQLPLKLVGKASPHFSGVHQRLAVEVRTDRPLKEADDVEVGDHRERDDHARDEGGSGPKQSLPQLLTVFALGGGAGSLGVSLASSMVLVVPVVLAYLFLQRYFIESMAGSGVKG